MPKQLLTEEHCQEIVQRYNAGENSIELAKHYPVKDQQIRNILRKRGVKLKKRARPRYVDQHGYIYVRIDSSDEIGTAMLPKNSKYVHEHRLLMAKSLGRPLTRTETVHHIDGVRSK